MKYVRLPGRNAFSFLSRKRSKNKSERTVSISGKRTLSEMTFRICHSCELWQSSVRCIRGNADTRLPEFVEWLKAIEMWAKKMLIKVIKLLSQVSGLTLQRLLR